MTNSSSTQSLQNLLKSLVPNTLPKARGIGDNAIHHLNIVIFGKPNTGKSSISASIAEALNPYWVVRTSRNLPGIFYGLPQHFGILPDNAPRTVVLIADDMTKALDKLRGFVGEGEGKMSKKAYWLDKWYDIRGELKARGMSEGLAIMITTTHRFYGAPIDMRADVDLLLVRSTGTPGTFDSRFVEKALGTQAFLALKAKESVALSDRSQLGWTGWATKAGSGLIFIPRPLRQIPIQTSAPIRNAWLGKLLNWVIVLVLWLGGIAFLIWLVRH